MISINHATRVITIPQTDLTPVSAGLYELDVNDFRLWLKDLEDDTDGIQIPDTHRHNTEVTLGGVTLARSVEIINGYTITFEDGQYAVRLVGANNNIADVANVNQVSIRSNNSAGLIVTGAGDPQEVADAVASRSYEGSYTLQDIMRLMSAVLLAKISGAGTGTETFRNVGDTKDRVITTVDQAGNRSSVTLDPT
jgi:hypothetical protein